MEETVLNRKIKKIMESLASFDKKIIWGFSVLILAGIFIINLIWTSHNAYDLYETVTIVRSYFNLPLLLIAFIFIIWAAKSWLKFEKSRLVLAILTILYVAAIGYIIFNSRTFIRADSMICWEAAGSFLKGDFAQLQYDGYFTRSPYQLGLVLYDIVLRLIWDNSKILYLFNIAWVLLINWCGYRIASRLFDNPVISRLTYLVELLFLPQLFMVMFGYGTIPGFACTMVAFYFCVCVCISDKPTIKWLLFMVLFAILAVAIKQNYSIAIIAMVIMLFIRLLQKKGYRLYFLLAIIFVLVLPLKTPDLIQAGFEAVSGISMAEPEPMLSYIAMGTDLDNTERGPGWYDGSTLWDYVNNDYDATKQLVYEKDKLIANIQGSLDDPARALSFYFHKVISEWCDPLFESVWCGPIVDLEGNMYVDKPLLVSLYTGAYAEKAVSAFSKCMLIIILGATLGFLIRYRKKLEVSLVFPLYMVGGFIFHFFSEGKSQYTYMYVFALMPMASVGLYDLAHSVCFDKLLIYVRELKEKLSQGNRACLSQKDSKNTRYVAIKEPVYKIQLLVTVILLALALYKTYIPVYIDTTSMNLPVGSYSLCIDYQCGNDSKVRLGADNIEAIHAGEINLSHFTNQVKYDFYVTEAVEGASLVVTDCLAGDLAINKVTLTTTGAAARLLLFIWLMAIFYIDFYLSGWLTNRARIINLLFLAISIVTVAPLFAKGLHYGHDVIFHLQRIEGIAEGLSQGQFPVRMNTVLNEGYGYPVDIFYGNLLLYVPAILRLIGFSILSAYKLYIWFVTILTLVLTYLCGKAVLKDDRLAIIVALAYTTASYRGVDIYNRAAVGEYSALAFLPLVMLAFWNIYTGDITKKNYKKNAFTLALGMSLLVYTHVLSTEMTCIVAFLVAIIIIKRTIRKETILVLLEAVGLTVSFCLAYFVPFFDYYIRTDINLKHLEKSDSLIQSLGAYIGQYFAFFRDIYETNDVAGRMQISPGLCLMIALIAALALIVVGQGNRCIYFFSAMSVFLLWLSSDAFPWNAISTLPVLGEVFTSVQYPWRYLALASLFMAILLGLVLQQLMRLLAGHGKMQFAVMSLAVVLALITAVAFDISYMTDVDSTHIYDTAELKNHVGDNSQDEYGIYGTDYESLGVVIGVNEGHATLIRQSGLDMLINVEAPRATGIEIPRTAYPNYRAVTSDGTSLHIVTGYNNRVRVELPQAYSGTITVSYIVPWYWRLAEIISLLSLVWMLIYVYKGKLGRGCIKYTVKKGYYDKV